jgi:hypothetical protein
MEAVGSSEMSVLCTNIHGVVTLKSGNFISVSEEIWIRERQNLKV